MKRKPKLTPCKECQKLFRPKDQWVVCKECIPYAIMRAMKWAGLQMGKI